jgi:hypothetical protein
MNETIFYAKRIMTNSQYVLSDYTTTYKELEWRIMKLLLDNITKYKDECIKPTKAVDKYKFV